MAQDSYLRNRASFSAAGVASMSGYLSNNYSVGSGFDTGYSFRFTRFTAAEMSYSTAWLGYAICAHWGCVDERDRAHFVNYGLRFILPLRSDRVQLSAGIGGAHVHLPDDTNYFGTQTLLQYSVGASVALDRRSHWRLESMLRFYRDTGRPTQQWVMPSAGISYNF